MHCRSLVWIAYLGAMAACATAGTASDDPDARTSSPVPDAAGSLPDARGPADASPPDAPELPDAAPQCTDTVIQLLANPGFDLGPTGGGWVQVADFQLIYAADMLAVTPQAGTHAAWLGGTDSATDVLFQTVAIPAGATNLQITGFRQIDTEDSPVDAYDTVTLSLRTPSDQQLAVLAEWSNLDAATGWRSFSFSPAGSFAGQNIRLHLRSQTDGSLYTDFFFDSLAMHVTVCQ